MSPQIEIDADIMEFLQSKAEPLIDTPSSVLRRLLNLEGTAGNGGLEDDRADDEHMLDRPRTSRKGPAKRKPAARKNSSRTRAPSGTLLPEQEYVLPLLNALDAAGGDAPYREVLDAVGKEIHDKLMPADFEELASGGTRWHSRLQFVRLRLIERGDMDRNAPRGIWRISDSGRATLAAGMNGAH